MSDIQKPAPTAYQLLRRRVQLFVDEYILDGNGAQAAIRSGYRGIEPKRAAYRWMKMLGVREAIEERKAEAIRERSDRMGRWLDNLEAITTFDPRRLLTPEGNLLPIDQWPDDVAAAVSGLDIEDLFEGAGKDRTRIGTVRKYRAWNKIEAAKVLLQFYGALKERHEVTGKDGKPLAPGSPVYIISKEEATQIRQELEAAV